MKQLLGIFLLFAIACTNAPDKESLSMTGAYKMTTASVKSDAIDTSYSSLLQLKLFSDGYVMYANVNPADSVSGFGIGSYTTHMDTVSENMMYYAKDSSKSDAERMYSLLINKSATGYKQVIADMQLNDTTKITLTEDYESVGTAATSPLDGLWKLVTTYYINGTDTSRNEMTQYKMYGAGHFIWGHTWTDSTNQLKTGIGYGTFAMEGTDKVKESVTASTYADARGHNFDLAIEMNGNDEYKQTITLPDGALNVEIYQRVKK